MDNSKKKFVENVIQKYLTMVPQVFSASGMHIAMMLVISDSDGPFMYKIPEGEHRFDFYDRLRLLHPDAIAVLTISEIWSRDIPPTHPYYKQIQETGLIPENVKNQLPRKEYLYFQIEKVYEELVKIHQWEILGSGTDRKLGTEEVRHVEPNQHSSGLIIKRGRS